MSKMSLNELAKKLGYKLEKCEEFQGRKSVYKDDKFIGNLTAHGFVEYLKEQGDIE